jgi:hypothetical protein
MNEFRNKLIRYRIQPAPDVWSKIEAGLEKQQKRNNLTYLYRWASVAASLLIVVAVYFFSKQPSSTEISKKDGVADSTVIQKQRIETVEQVVKLKETENRLVEQKKATAVRQKKILVETQPTTTNYNTNQDLPTVKMNRGQKERALAFISPLSIRPVGSLARFSLPIEIWEHPVALNNEQRIHAKWLKLISEEILEEPDSTLTERVLDLANRRTISVFQNNVKPTLVQWYRERIK